MTIAYSDGHQQAVTEDSGVIGSQLLPECQPTKGVLAANLSRITGMRDGAGK